MEVWKFIFLLILSFRHRRGSTKVLSLKKVKEDKNAFYSGECNYVVQFNENVCEIESFKGGKVCM